MKPTLPRKYWDGRCYNLKVRAELLRRYSMPTVQEVLHG